MNKRNSLWYKDAIVYETHVRAFFDSTNDGVGDFRGLIQKLDYLQDLGITCIWLLPFYPSPLRDDGYDIASYKGVHPMYGTTRDFRAFVNEAHKRDIHVITELVINHTSDQHPWFLLARKSPAGSKRRNFYVWSNNDQKYKGTRIIFTDTEKSNWSWDQSANAYYWHRFFHHQPDLNFDNPDVLREIVKVLRFWLDMGVDGLRLDAVPYLIEREGTNCENLYETHQILKQIRREMDLHYDNRMLIAEANQWPEDVLPYFGDSDQCHMAFHFPLMPRIFMALRQEDRHPITDILRQTPDPPDACQWGLFLRNHDELTLEMVTDEERDYMYNAYAADPRMRVNIGIRRRLAPLMDNSRRRMELLNSLLFSFRGTPILYYGDEIGMGDNVYLGDRNGVRTPMQWSSDRNAGFSRADFAKLYSPPIMDPVYGYQSINVEAQQRDPSSLLHWMKRMIAMRKRYNTFGRGTMQILLPENRKVLAYVRKNETATILCLANLSRFVQPTQLNLGEFANLAPVELMGRTQFPKIGTAPYFFSLAPHSFYWFELMHIAEMIRLQGEESLKTEIIPVLALRGNWESFLQDENRKRFENEVLPMYLPGRRWYGEKTDRLMSVEILDYGKIAVHDRWTAVLILLSTQNESAESRMYSVPVVVSRFANIVEEPGERVMLAKLRNKAEVAAIWDAMTEDRFCSELARWIIAGKNVQTQRGSMEIRLSSTTPFELQEPVNVSRNIGEQSNSSVILNNTFILKLFRKVEPGLNPEYEISRFLSEKTEFDRMPRFVAAVEYTSAGHDPVTLAIVQTAVQNQGTAWDYTLDEVVRFLERTLTSEHTKIQSPPPLGTPLPRDAIDPKTRDLLGIYLNHAALLGTRTAEFHLALASRPEDPDFAPEPISEQQTADLASALNQYAESVFLILEQSVAKLAGPIQTETQSLLQSRLSVLNPYEELIRQPVRAIKTRVHGDYHLGQVLWVKNDFVLIDFEGEPARSIAERRQKQLPLKDVAGMIRSFSYAGYFAMQRISQELQQPNVPLRQTVRCWHSWISNIFLNAYLQTARSKLYPNSTEEIIRVLRCFLFDKALYEVLYELNHRPEWVSIPLTGLKDLMDSFNVTDSIAE